MMRSRFLLALAVTLAGAVSPASVRADGRDLTRYVDTRAGSFGSGFPMVGASVPFGMIQPGPDTGLLGAEDPFTYDGYMYEDPVIRGFSLTHFDGAGIHIAGDLPFMPTTGAIQTDPNSYASPYDHADEIARPGYYEVGLARYQTKVELSATERAGIERFTFPATTQANVLVDVSRSIPGAHPGLARIVGDHSIQGWMRSGDTGGYTLFFDAEFDRPFAGFGTWTGSVTTPGSAETEGSANGAYVTFDTTGDPVVHMRVGVSYVDQAGAGSNLAAEIPADRAFESVRKAAHDAWNVRLHDIDVSGGEPGQLETFYTCLYRVLGMPSIFDDADARYLGFDGVAHTIAAGHHHYTNLSLWDTYRTQTPLLELIEPFVVHDVMISLLDDYDQNHLVLPKWTQANLDYGIMGGDSATATLADGVMRGILTGAEARRAYDAMLHQATTLPPVSPREHLDEYLARGYVGNDVSGRGTALTQEYAIDDAALANVASFLGTSADAATLRARASSWRNVLYPGLAPGDPNANFIRPRNSDGSWANPTGAGPVAVWNPIFQDGYQEATGWQQLWLEPQDVAGLVDALGGRDIARSRLDSFFSEALLVVPYAVPVAQQYASLFGIYYVGNQFTPANEPDLQTPWFYNWLGQPWKTQKVVRAAMQVFSARPDGLPGNDDTGTMSAWYVMAAIGLYGLEPGVPMYTINSPAFERVVLRLGSMGEGVTISAPGASSAAKYIRSASLDGASLDRTYVTQCELRSGATLRFRLSALPDTGWASSPDVAPPSLSSPPSAPASGCEGSILGG